MLCLSHALWAQNATYIQTGAKKVKFNPMLFGQFIEHFDSQIYGGIYQPGNPLSDEDGFRKDVETIHTMGFDGKSIINPRQIAIVHEIYTPKPKDITFAEKVVREIDTKKAQGIGVFTVDGKMIDIAFYDGAKRTLALAKASGVYKGDL